jgi:hypothetical protein
MNAPDDRDLHEALRNLPLRKAPPSLMPLVLATIQAEASLPWWQRKFGQWPLWAQFVVPVATAGCATAATLAFRTGYGTAVAQGSESIETLRSQTGWILTLGRALSEAVSGAMNHLPASSPWLFAFLLAGLASCALVAAASGTILARMARSQTSS